MNNSSWILFFQALKLGGFTFFLRTRKALAQLCRQGADMRLFDHVDVIAGDLVGFDFAPH